MTRGFLLVVVTTSVALLAHAADSQAKPSDAATMKMEGEGINLWMSSSHPTFGQPEDPTFWVHAERGQLLDEPRIWSLEQTRAVIYRDPPEEDLVLVARTGTFDEQNKSAKLDGDVRVTSGRMVADLENIRWDNAAGVAYSEGLATLDDGVNRLVGRAVAMYAKEGRFELGDGTAHIQLAQSTDDAQQTKKKPQAFESISIPKPTKIVGKLSGGVQELAGPVELNLIGVDPADTLNIKANRVNFEYAADDEKMPTKVFLKGNVSLKQTDATFSADEGTIDLNSRKARFQGHVTMSGEQFQGASGEYFELDLDTGDFEFFGAIEQFKLIPSEKAEKPADPKP